MTYYFFRAYNPDIQEEHTFAVDSWDAEDAEDEAREQVEEWGWEFFNLELLGEADL